MLFLLTRPALSQTINLKNYTVLNGLANSTVYHTIQDSKGFLWVATTAGVNRFDGKKFEVFTTDDGLADNEVLGMYEDSKGRIWFLNFNGRFGYYYNGKFYNPENEKTLKKAVTKASIINCFEDSSNRLWFSTNQQQIIEIAGDKVNVHSRPHKDVDISNTFIFEDKNNRVIAANVKGFYLLHQNRIQLFPSRFLPASLKSFKYNKRTRQLLFLSRDGLIAYDDDRFKITRNLPENVSVTEMGSFLINKTDLLVVSQSSGLHIIKPDGKYNEHYLKDKMISHIMLDRDNNIWASTLGHGLIVLPAHTENVRQYSEETGLPDHSVYSVFKERSGKLWLGLKSGLICFIEGKKITTIDLNNSQNPFNPVKKFEYDQKNNSVWFASSTALGEIKINNPLEKVRYLKEKNNLAFSVKSFSISKKGKFAFSLASGVYILDDKDKPLVFETNANLPNQKFFPDRSFKILYDSKERLWFSNVNGLFRYADGKVDTLSKYCGVLSNRVTDMIEMPDGNMVIGTYGYGMVILKPDNRSTLINIKSGLNSNICRKIAYDGKYLWLTTFSGVDRMEYRSANKKIDTYRIKDGLTSDEVLDIYIDENKIYLGTNNGLTVLPRNTPSVSVSPPLFYITDLNVNGKQYNHWENHKFLYNENNVSVDYTAINFSQSEEVYEYRLKPDAPWVRTKNTTIEFGSLEPGDYKLSIRARVQDSGWSKIAETNFFIQPAFWQRWWFLGSLYSFISIVVIALIYTFFKRQRATEKEKLLVQTKIIALEQRALQAMMNPHFVFNIMNSIQYFINTKDSHSANQVLTGFAKLIRKNMEICTKSYISLEEELIYLKLYLSLEKLRFGDKMMYDVSVADGIDTEETMIPSMLLQPFVENAIWHGIMPKDEGGKISIRIESDLTELSIKITDNGTGIENSLRDKNGSHVSRGMQITHDRINLLNMSNPNGPISIKTRQTGNSGTCVLVKIPS